MKHNGFSVGLNTPNALSGDQTFNLPPYAPQKPFLVDKYPACPKNWMRSEGKTKSFFVPVIEGKGMWLDFNENEKHTHHVAIVISIQGVNPITGMPCNDAHMEQYIEQCPKHKISFGPDRYCKKCNYKWPKQNYICTTGTPNGLLWIDGFRTVDGIVRQYILTKERIKGVASHIIGKDRVYAIGLSFFVSKEKKPQPSDSDILIQTTKTCNPIWIVPKDYYQPYQPYYYPLADYYKNYPYTTTTSIQYNMTVNQERSLSNMGGGTTFSNCNSPSQIISCSNNIKTVYSVDPVQTKKIEIGAGANINQFIYDDPEKLEYWHDYPESIICINYCEEQNALKIIEKGEIDTEGHKEGFLKEIPVGN